MGDEVTWVGVTCISVTVDGAGPRVQGTVVINDNLVDAEDCQCPCYPAWACYPLVCRLEAALKGSAKGQVSEGMEGCSLCDDTAGHSNGDGILAATGWLKSSTWLESGCGAVVGIVIDAALLQQELAWHSSLTASHHTHTCFNIWPNWDV